MASVGTVVAGAGLGVGSRVTGGLWVGNFGGVLVGSGGGSVMALVGAVVAVAGLGLGSPVTEVPIRPAVEVGPCVSTGSSPPPSSPTRRPETQQD